MTILQGSYCPHCKGPTPTSVHGRCDCGYQKFPSKVLAGREKPFKPFVTREKVIIEDIEEIDRIMRKPPKFSDHMREVR